MIIWVVLLILVVLLAIYLYMCIPRGYSGGKDVVKNLKSHPRTKSDAAVISYFEEITGHSFPTVLPDWLVWNGKKLELDGYNEELNMAVEFSGPLHTKWFPQKENYKKYYNRLLNDAAKNKICKRRGINLITIDMSLPLHHWRTYILSRLYDVGVQPKPVNYILEQTAKPFRNPQLEQELKLHGLDDST
jgi:hypothetical protein